MILLRNLIAIRPDRAPDLPVKASAPACPMPANIASPSLHAARWEQARALIWRIVPTRAPEG